jgi:hypothetical protein
MLEGDSWKEAKMDKGKIDKMSGTFNGLSRDQDAD